MSIPCYADEGYRPLTRAEVQTEIEKLDLSRRGGVRRVAEVFAGDLTGDGRDLLHDAVCRPLTSRQCRQDLTVERFLSGIMRSIASTTRRSRERRGEEHVFLPVDDVAERLAVGGYVVRSPDQIIELERVRQLCSDVLDVLAAASPTQAALIEGISLGFRGGDLADHLGISQPDLATVRRNLKRHVQRLWPQIDLSLSQSAAGAAAENGESSY